MRYTTTYPSPLGEIVLTADGLGLTGLWFAGGKCPASTLSQEPGAGESPVFAETKRWLDIYFSGQEPDFTPSIHMTGTPFQLEVWELLRRIPYGKTTTYGELAEKIARQRGLAKLSAQAVGGAVGRNPVSILVPCHRVVGKNGSLTGYAGGIDKKAALLRLEGAVGEIRRCGWVNLKNPAYVSYHDNEWGKPHHDDGYFFEMLVLESFQAGLSWECVLNKREAFRAAFDGFDAAKVAAYGPEKLAALAQDSGIIRNRRKIAAAVQNAAVFLEIQGEYGSFSEYIWHFSGGKQVVNRDGVLRATSPLSDAVSQDLKRRGMRFVGSTIIYSYLQAVGVIDDHEPGCAIGSGEGR